MDRGRAVLAVGTGLIALTLTAACAAPETTPAATPVTVTVTTATPQATSTPTPAATQRPSAKPTKPVGLLSKPPTTKPKLPPITKKPTVKKPTTKPTARRTTTKPPVSDAYYANCSEVRAAGAAPIHAGDPGYSRKLDRDGDGIACEN